MYNNEVIAGFFLLLNVNSKKIKVSIAVNVMVIPGYWIRTNILLQKIIASKESCRINEFTFFLSFTSIASATVEVDSSSPITLRIESNEKITVMFRQQLILLPIFNFCNDNPFSLRIHIPDSPLITCKKHRHRKYADASFIILGSLLVVCF